MESRKEKGQYITPEKIVVMILDDIGYAGDEVLTKKIMEPSFGDGAFLSEIVKRIIKEGQKQSLSEAEISNIIQNNVFGIEKDEKIYKKAIGRLNSILEEYKIPKIEWKNLINGDTLTEWENHKEKYDYVVGNPPFVRIHNIPEGFAVGLTFAIAASNSSITFASALALALGIGLQNLPEGAAISLPLKQEGMSRTKAFVYGSLSGIVEPIAGVIAGFTIHIMQTILPICLSFAAGAMMYVVVEELIPEAQLGKHSHVGTFGVLSGFVIMMLMDVFLG